MKKTMFSMMAAAAIVFYFISTANAVGGDYQPVKKTADTQTDYINGLTHKDGKWYITADKIDWYEGAQADEQFLKHEPDSGLDGAPDGYYIVNDDSSVQTYEVAPNAEVLMQIYDKGNDAADTEWNEPISLEKFAQLYPQTDVLDLSYFPYHITVKDGIVTKIVQQFVP